MKMPGPLLLVRDHFAQPTKDQFGIKVSAAKSQVALLAAAGAPVPFVFIFEVRISVLSGLLTATSILTGLTFTMALRFWERSLDARSNSESLREGVKLQILDKMRAHLVWTVLVGVLATGVLALGVIFTGQTVPVWFSAIAAFLVLYQVLLVGGAIFRFYELAYVLRP